MRLYMTDTGSEDGCPRCPGCGWDVSPLYALADSQEEADRLEGLCSNCMCEWLLVGTVAGREVIK